MKLTLPKLPNVKISDIKKLSPMTALAQKTKLRSIPAYDHPFDRVATVGEYLTSLEKFGERVMFVWKDSGIRHEMKYIDFVILARQLTVGFAENFGTGKKIAVIGETSAHWLAAYLAIIASGNTVVPMDKELNPEQISAFFEVAEVSAVVFSGTFNKVFSGMIAGHKTLRKLIPISSDGMKESKKVITLSHLSTLGKNSKLPYAPDVDRERCCELLFTSGTTGTSKCVMLCQRNIFTSVNSACASTDFGPDDLIVSVLPLHHTYALTCNLAYLNYGGIICINSSLRYLLRDFKEYKPTALVLVPLFVTTMYKKILAEAAHSGKERMLATATSVSHVLGLAGIDISERVFKDIRDSFGGRLTKIVCGGAALDPKLTEAFDAFGIYIYEGYGITECSPLVAVSPYDKRKAGSVGPTVECCTAKIDGFSEEDGHIVGEILVKGDNVMLGYMNNDEANRAVFTDDGWFRTGDVGYMDEDGYLYITGRKKSVIVLDNGKNVFPEEIEEYLAKIDEINESVVVGREEEDGIKLTALIFPNYEKNKEMSDDEIRSLIQKKITALNKTLPSFKQIHRIEYRKTEFEKTTTKKIMRHLVK